MTTSIVLEVHSDDPGLRDAINDAKALGEHSTEYLEILAALHQFEAGRLMREVGFRRGQAAAFPRRSKR